MHQDQERRMRHADRVSTRGSVLILSYFVITVLLGLAIPQTMRALSSTRLESLYKGERQARHLAEAGLDNAMSLLRNGQIVPSDSTMTCRWDALPATCPGPTGNLTQAPISMTSGKLEASVAGPDLAAASPMDRVFHIRARGTTSSESNIQRLLEAKVELDPAPLFAQAVFAWDTVQSIYLNLGAVIDSYNSTLGPYGGANIAANGDVETNRDLADGMSVFIGSEIRGKALFNGLAPGETIASGGGLITGAAQPQLTPKPTYNVMRPPGQPASCSSLTPLSLATDTTLAGAGPFCFTSISTNGHSLTFSDYAQLYVQGTVDVSNGGQLKWHAGTIESGNFYVSPSGLGTGGLVEVTGKTSWYVTGDVRLDNGARLNANTKLPNLFRLYGRQTSGEMVYVDHGSKFYGVIYAAGPDVPPPGTPGGMAVRIDNGSELFGAVIAPRVLVIGAGSFLHYDEALKTVKDFPLWSVPKFSVGTIPPSSKRATVKFKSVRFCGPVC